MTCLGDIHQPKKPSPLGEGWIGVGINPGFIRRRRLRHPWDIQNFEIVR